MEKKNVKLKKEELKPSYSKLKSFHQKAWVITDEKGNKKLQSFESIIAEIIDGKVKIHDEVKMWDSKSSIRHLNNFLFENGLATGNTKELTELYITKTKKITKAEDKEEPKKETKQDENQNLKNKKDENSKTEDKPQEDSKIENSKKLKNKKVENSKIENQEELVEVGA